MIKIEQKVYTIFPRFIVGQIVYNNSSFPYFPMVSISSINPLLRGSREDTISHMALNIVSSNDSSIIYIYGETEIGGGYFDAV